MCEGCHRIHATVNGRVIDYHCHCNTRKYRAEHKGIVYLKPICKIDDRGKILWADTDVIDVDKL